METLNVTELWIYPVKGMQGIPVDSIEVTELGIVGDREFALWEDGKLVDQKTYQWVAAISADYDPLSGVLHLSHEEHGEFVHIAHDTDEVREGRWGFDKFNVVDQGDDVAVWLSSVLSRDVRLVTAKEPWRVNFPIPQMKRLHGGSKVRFNAASPVSIANEASLEELNKHLDHAVDIDRFRMNVIVDGLDAFAEDGIDRLSNADIAMSSVSPAERCIIVTTDQRTGERPRNNLLRELRDLRRKPKEDRYGSGLKFGNYLAIERPGHLSIGDTLRVSFIE